MFLIGEKKYIEATFNDETEIENVITANYEHFFGAESIFISKTKISTCDGIGTIPDGFAVNIASKHWFIVEVELEHHGAWRHIIPQVSKQISASVNPQTKDKMIDTVVELYRQDDSVKEKFSDEGIQEIDVRKVLNEIFQRNPVIGLLIDRRTEDLVVWSSTLRYKVEIWEVKKYTQFDEPQNVAYLLPDLDAMPVYNAGQGEVNSDNKTFTNYNITIADLVEKGLLQVGQKLLFPYKGQTFEAIVTEEGNLKVAEQLFTSPSYAALYCIQQAGSQRKSQNGWKAWKTETGELLDEIRKQSLTEHME